MLHKEINDLSNKIFGTTSPCYNPNYRMVLSRAIFNVINAQNREIAVLKKELTDVYDFIDRAESDSDNKSIYKKGLTEIFIFSKVGEQKEKGGEQIGFVYVDKTDDDSNKTEGNCYPLVIYPENDHSVSSGKRFSAFRAALDEVIEKFDDIVKLCKQHNSWAETKQQIETENLFMYRGANSTRKSPGFKR